MIFCNYGRGRGDMYIWRIGEIKSTTLSYGGIIVEMAAFFRVADETFPCPHWCYLLPIPTVKGFISFGSNQLYYGASALLAELPFWEGS